MGFSNREETKMVYLTLDTREYDPKAAHASEFYAIDYDIAYKDQLELVDRFVDSLEYELKYDSNQRPSDMIHQIIDEWLTTYDTDIAMAWLRAGCPQPDIHPDYTTKEELPIVRQMISALYELGYGFVSALLDGGDTLAGTLERINTFYPYPTT